LEAKQKGLAENKTLIQKGRHLAEQIIGEDQQKIIAIADRLELNDRAVERARLAQDVYSAPGEKNPPVGWKRLSNNPEDLPQGLQDVAWEHEKSGFRAALYESEIDDSKVLVFRGTVKNKKGSVNNRMAGWKNNLQQGAGLESEQYELAMALAMDAKNVYGDKLEIAGHSLGGGLTSAGSIVTDSPGFSFNSAGLHSNTIRPYGKTRTDGTQLVHAYHVKGEILTAGQTVVSPDAVGTPHRLPSVDQYGKPVSITKAHPVARHGMDYVINGIEKQMADDKTILTDILRKP
jgi:hypothetical protein